MPKTIDAAGKDLFECDPVGWAGFLGAERDADRIKLIDTDLSSVSAAADKGIRIDDPNPWILNVEFQAWRNRFAPHQLMKYNALLFDRHHLPVESHLVVLTHKANSSAYTGSLIIKTPLRPAWTFPYNVVKVWKLSPEKLLSGPIGLLPLAPISAVKLRDVPGVIRDVDGRLRLEADPAIAERSMMALAFLLQMRYGPVTTEEMLKRYPDIRDTVFYKLFIEKSMNKGEKKGRKEGEKKGVIMGRLDGQRQMILNIASKRLGPPQDEHLEALNNITKPKDLEEISDRLLDAHSWDDLIRIR